MTFTIVRPILLRLIVIALAACLALIVSGLAASQASAQGICTQYPDLPQCQEDDDDGDEGPDEGGEDEGGDDLGPSGGGAAGGDADGGLPFTGYPLTPLILLLLLLLAIGIAIRMYLVAREKRQAALADGLQNLRL